MGLAIGGIRPSIDRQPMSDPTHIHKQLEGSEVFESTLSSSAEAAPNLSFDACPEGRSPDCRCCHIFSWAASRSSSGSASTSSCMLNIHPDRTPYRKQCTARSSGTPRLMNCICKQRTASKSCINPSAHDHHRWTDADMKNPRSKPTKILRNSTMSAKRLTLRSAGLGTSRSTRKAITVEKQKSFTAIIHKLRWHHTVCDVTRSEFQEDSLEA
mmetsp:Transcript_23417/g.54065  ORF Transcript_23417/g.54065 Transcript_23417/m.54065 type:complete len:213 (+) Transcript_23417:521-1159(+)